MDINDAIKERIMDLCSINNVSINKLCTMSGITQSTINNIMSGRNQSTTVLTIKRLCDGLDISLSEFFSSQIFDDIDREIN